MTKKVCGFCHGQPVGAAALDAAADYLNEDAIRDQGGNA